MTTSIWERIVTALSALTLTKAANVLIVASEVDRPDEYLVYSLVSSPPVQHADDAETMRAYRVQINYYNRAGLTGMPDIDGAMTTAGFERGTARELPYNQQTRHYGLALEYVFVE